MVFFASSDTSEASRILCLLRTLCAVFGIGPLVEVLFFGEGPKSGEVMASREGDKQGSI